MATREVNGNTYAEFAVVAGDALPVVQGLEIPSHDNIQLTYTGENLTGVAYRVGSATVATLTLAYSGSKLTSVTKS
jgi:hypothetical protein